MMKDKKRNPALRKRVRMPIEDYPSQFAPRDFYSRDARRQAADRNTASVDREPDFGNCAQCNAPQTLSERADCYNCGSDNRTNREV